MRMRGLFAIMVLLVTAPCVQAQAEPGTVAFTNVTVLPMDRAGTLEDQTVVVVNGVITELGSSVPVGEGTMVIDGEGRYLMPGLAEMHAHVPSGADPPRDAVEDILFLYIANGYHDHPWDAGVGLPASACR